MGALLAPSLWLAQLKAGGQVRRASGAKPRPLQLKLRARIKKKLDYSSGDVTRILGERISFEMKTLIASRFLVRVD